MTLACGLSVGRRTLGKMILEHNTDGVLKLVAGGWIVGEVAKGKKRIGSMPLTRSKRRLRAALATVITSLYHMEKAEKPTSIRWMKRRF